MKLEVHPELLPDATMRCGQLIARPLRLPARRVYKDRRIGDVGEVFQVCDIGPLGTAHSWALRPYDREVELTAFDLLCLAALVDEVGR